MLRTFTRFLPQMFWQGLIFGYDNYGLWLWQSKPRAKTALYYIVVIVLYSLIPPFIIHGPCSLHYICICYCCLPGTQCRNDVVSKSVRPASR